MGAEFPLDASTVNATVAVVGPVAVAVPMSGALGAPSGVTDDDAAEAVTEVPTTFVAVAVNVYEVPLVKPVTSQDPGAVVAVHVLVV